LAADADIASAVAHNSNDGQMTASAGPTSSAISAYRADVELQPRTSRFMIAPQSRREAMIGSHAFAPMLLAAGLAVAVLPATALAQQTSEPSTDDQTPPAFDPTARIKSLHDRLRITAEQEPRWDAVAQAIRDNARDIAPLLKERFRAITNGSALDVLHAYAALGEAQLDNFKAFTAAFEPLYASLPDNQKRIADAVLRESAQNAMIGGLPVAPGPLVYPLGYAPLPIVPGIPLFGYRLGGFHRFHGFGAPGPHFGRFHH
jgi:hypothetical protein